MKTVYSPLHAQHAPEKELLHGGFTEYFEKPSRAEYVLNAVTGRRLGPVISPGEWGEESILGVHSAAYVKFLRDAHREWTEAGYEGDTFGYAFNVQHPGFGRRTTCIDGKLGLFTGDSSVPLTATSWTAIQASAWTALTAQDLIAKGERSAFALCRPPGHHATATVAAGYCYLNNAAIAAQAFLDGGAKRVSLLDVDYHHGNGTQAIFYDRADVQFLSIHADPALDYPYFLGYEDERGQGAGEGCNFNYPLPFGTDFSRYGEALGDAVRRIDGYGPDVVVVSLGVDTFREDPISKFKLDSGDYLKMGAAIAGLGKPTLFVMEGGYAVEEIGINVANVLEGFLEAQR